MEEKRRLSLNNLYYHVMFTEIKNNILTPIHAIPSVSYDFCNLMLNISNYI